MPERQRRSVAQTFLLDLLITELSERTPPNSEVRVLDVGGGTGIVATALGALGYDVTVIDPSPDALASLDRRSAERGLAGRVRGVQGDTGDLASHVEDGSIDVLVLHRVLDVVEEPEQAMAAVARTLRPGGLLSLVVEQGPAVVLAQGLAGQFAQALQTATDPARMRYDAVVRLVEDAGLEVLSSHGIGVVSDLVPESLIDRRPSGHDELIALERALSHDPVFRPLAHQLHVLAVQAEDRLSSRRPR